VAAEEEAAKQQAAAEQERLNARAADFAVDPQRERTWNYEPNGRKVVYLTIDDGPSQNTQAVLDILDKYGCKATFFVTAIDPDYFYQIGEAYRRGHTIGMHTASHDYSQVYASQAAYFADLDAIAGVVKEQIGYVPCFIRFPGGSSNQISANYTPGIMSALVGEVQARGYQYYDWNASSGDGSVHTADELVGYACEYGDLENVVLLCHDSSTKQTTVEALPRIIEHYQSLGYTFEAIDPTTFVPHHGVSN
jgi:peptidoglycan/xylan/chitin deacetylase (PgdA/CDA1 family)